MDIEISERCCSCGRWLRDDDEVQYHSYEVWCLDCLQIKNKAIDCSRCKDLVKSRSQIVEPYGNRARGLCFVGESPGARGADLSGIPFKGGRSSEFLMDELKRIKVSFANARFLNAVKCCSGRRRAPTKKEVMNCNSQLKVEIKGAKLVVCLGAIAFNAVTGRRAQVLRNSLKIYDNVVMIMHPSYAQRFNKRRKFRVQVEALKKIISSRTEALR